MARLGRSQEAFANYEKALALDPACPSAHLNLAVTYVQEGKFAAAESHYRQALPGRPGAETHNGLGYVLARQGRTEEAIAEYRRAIEANPQFTPAYTNLAQELVAQGKPEEAIEYYDRSLAPQPNPAVQRARDALRKRLGGT
jgi:Flp pilus assembly protein TadD